MPQTLNAGMVSYNGLIPLFGTTGSNGTSEVEIGIMEVTNLNDWLGRLADSSASSSGPTGAWATEWFSVWNYLQYGGSCVIGGTGSTGPFNTATLGITSTPLHNKNLVDLDIVFDGGNTFSIGAATNIANTRQDCIAVIGNYQNINNLNMSSAYSGFTTDFGVTAGSKFIVPVANRKKFTYIGPDGFAKVYESSLSADVAGCFARTASTENIWIAPVGFTRGRILNVINLTQKYSDTDISYFTSGGVNAIQSVPGQGTFVLSNNTSYIASVSPVQRINTMMTITYIKKQLAVTLKQFLFELNTATTRQKVINAATPLLNSIQAGNGISAFTLICDESNNTPAVQSTGALILDVSITLVYPITTITIRVLNSATGEVLIT